MKRLAIIIFFGLFFICKPAISAVVPGEVTSHLADAEIVYNWFSYVPTTIDKSVPIFILVNADIGGAYFDYDEITENAESYANGKKNEAEQHGYVLIRPAIPRTLHDDISSEIYGVAFDKDIFR